jgi:hypothetical protein
MKHASTSRSLQCAALILGLALTGCGIRETKSEAEAFVAAHFQSLRAKDFNKALDSYTPQFFANMPKEEWEKMLPRVQEKLGEYQSHQISGWNMQKKAGTGAGTYVTLKCVVQYARYPAQEELTVFRPPGGGGFKILAHQINSAGLLKE